MCGGGWHQLLMYNVSFVCIRRVGQVKLHYMPPTRELEKALAARFIMTMASSPPDQNVIRMFLYAQHVRNWERKGKGRRGGEWGTEWNQ